MRRSFNIAGPCNPERHYMVPAESRTPNLGRSLEKSATFAVHAPRQSGKTTAMRALARRLTAEGRYAALHFSCESARAFTDIGSVEQQIWQVILDESSKQLPEALRPPDSIETSEGNLLLARLRLSFWRSTSSTSARPASPSPTTRWSAPGP